MHKRIISGSLLLVAGLPLRAEIGFAVESKPSLAAAVRSRNDVAVRELLKEGAIPNQRLADGSVPLAWAIDRQDVKAVQLLLAAGADPNALDFYGSPLLTSACELGNEEIVLALLGAGANPMATREDGITAFALCSGNSTALVVKRLAEKGADVNQADRELQTPLMRAAAAGALDNIGLLITLGADIDAKTPKGATPLFFALQSKDPTAAEMLLDAGATTAGLTPDGQTIIEATLAIDNEALAERLIKSKPDLDQRNARGWQLIHSLAAGGHTSLVALAIKLGANPNAFTEPSAGEPDRPRLNGATTQADAERGSDKSDAKENQVTEKVITSLASRTPLMLAAASGFPETMKALIEAGADPHARAPDGTTVALAAASSGDLVTVKYALQIDPPVSQMTRDGKTLLHIAVRSKNIRGAEALIPFLIEEGVSVDAEDSDGETVAGILKKNGPANLRAIYERLIQNQVAAKNTR